MSFEPSEYSRLATPEVAPYCPVPKMITYAPAGRSTDTALLTIALVLVGDKTAVTRGAVGPLFPKGVPVGRVPRAGTDRMAPKMVPPSETEAAVLMLSTWAGEFNWKKLPTYCVDVMVPPLGCPAVGGVVVSNRMIDWAGRTQQKVSCKAAAIYS